MPDQIDFTESIRGNAQIINQYGIDSFTIQEDDLADTESDFKPKPPLF